MTFLFLQTFDHVHATKESENLVTLKPHVKRVGERHTTEETPHSGDVSRPQVKSVGNKHVTQQSSGKPESRPHIRSYDNVHANKQSGGPEYDSVPKLKQGVMHFSIESKPVEWTIKKQSMFGHVSQLSSSYDFSVPKLKKSETMSAMKESDWSRDYCIKPKIRINKAKTANTQSEEMSGGRRAIKMSSRMSATKESEYVDHDAKCVQLFKERNVHGHATDSRVEKLLYRGKFTEPETETMEEGRCN